MAKQGLDGSLQCTARDLNADVTHAHTHIQWREEDQNDLKIAISVCGRFKEEQLGKSTKWRALEGNDTLQ